MDQMVLMTEKKWFSQVTDTDPDHKFYDNGGIRYAVNCPVDIIIYDENDNMVGKIQNDQVQNDQVQNITDNKIRAYIDSAGQKLLVFHRMENINWKSLPEMQEAWIILLLNLHLMVLD